MAPRLRAWQLDFSGVAGTVRILVLASESASVQSLRAYGVLKTDNRVSKATARTLSVSLRKQHSPSLELDCCADFGDRAWVDHRRNPIGAGPDLRGTAQFHRGWGWGIPWRWLNQGQRRKLLRNDRKRRRERSQRLRHGLQVDPQKLQLDTDSAV